VRVEGEDDRRPPDALRLVTEPLDQPCVAAMDAVEVANRQRTVSQLGGEIV
jgi:hypothetical protein